MDRALSAATVAIVRRTWASRCGVPLAELENPGLAFVTGPDTTAVVVVKLGQTVVVVAPQLALAKLTRLEPEQLLDLSVLCSVLDCHAPTPIGSASLAYADEGTIASIGSAAARDASGVDAEQVLSACSGPEREESGLDGMRARVVVAGRDGTPAALAGYHRWGEALAHIGVAVRPAERRQGLGHVAAAAAAHDAVVAGLVPQWRCSLDNLSSARLRDRLGFVELGLQVALELGRPSKSPRGDGAK